MRRREFITGMAGTTVAWPLATIAQQSDRVRRIGVLVPAAADETEAQASFAAFQEALARSGWAIGGNLRFETRWATANASEIRRHATELAALAPEVILTHGSSTLAPLLQATRTVPIVFVQIVDPVGAGFVDSLARPGGNVTGFMQFEYSLSAKWPELLKIIAPGLRRAAVLRDTAVPGGSAQFGVIQSAAQSLGIEVSPVNISDAPEIESTIAAFARFSNGGLIVTSSGPAVAHRGLIITLAARHKLPAVYFRRLFVASGGLISYGSDVIDGYRLAAGYVDRILKGEKPSDLPVQQSTKVELAINLKTAAALGISVPPALLARADEVIE